jgi:hypothetical protein
MFFHPEPRRASQDSQSPSLSAFSSSRRALTIPACSSFHLPPSFELSTVNSLSLSPFPATLASSPQPAENSATLSPAIATLTNCVNRNPFACHSYKKYPGWGPGFVNLLVAQTSVCGLLKLPVSVRSETKTRRNRKISLSCQSLPTNHKLGVTNHKSLSPLESALPQNTSISPVESALPKHST